jgi:hypothetical protein
VFDAYAIAVEESEESVTVFEDLNVIGIQHISEIVFGMVGQLRAVPDDEIGEMFEAAVEQQNFGDGDDEELVLSFDDIKERLGDKGEYTDKIMCTSVMAIYGVDPLAEDAEEGDGHSMNHKLLHNLQHVHDDLKIMHKDQSSLLERIDRLEAAVANK